MMTKIQRLRRDLIHTEHRHERQAVVVNQTFSIVVIAVMLTSCVASILFVLSDCIHDTHPTTHGLYSVVTVLTAALNSLHQRLYLLLTLTRRSAIAEGPRDALCLLKCCQLLHNRTKITFEKGCNR